TRGGNRMLAFASLTLVTLTCGGSDKGQGTPTAPTGTSSGPPAPLPNGNVSGRVENLDTVADLITYNQAANVGLSIPVEGRIERSTGIITRWELRSRSMSIRPSTATAEEALRFWQSVTGITFTLVDADAEPRITVRVEGETKHAWAPPGPNGHPYHGVAID